MIHGCMCNNMVCKSETCPCYGSYCIEGICNCSCDRNHVEPKTFWQKLKHWFNAGPFVYVNGQDRRIYFI